MIDVRLRLGTAERPVAIVQPFLALPVSSNLLDPQRNSSDVFIDSRNSRASLQKQSRQVEPHKRETAFNCQTMQFQQATPRALVPCFPHYLYSLLTVNSDSFIRAPFNRLQTETSVNTKFKKIFVFHFFNFPIV